MLESTFSLTKFLTFTNVIMSSVLVILAFSLLGYTLTYNFRNSVARRFALLLGCLMTVYAGDVALTRVVSADSAERWLRFQWLGIAILPAAAYFFSLAVLQTTNYRLRRRRWVGLFFLILALLCAGDAIFGRQVVGGVEYKPPLSYLQAGPLFWFFTLYFALAMLLALANIAKARGRCLTPNSHQRMSYLLLGFVAPGIGVFPYLIALSQGASVGQASSLVLLLSFFGNLAVAAMLVLLSYTVAYFGVLTPDRVVRYRLLRFFMRGPVVAILVILAMTTLPTVERILGLPRDMVVFSIITGVIVTSQLLLSVTKAIVDRLIYREDRDEIGWLSELDRRLLTTSDLRQFLENNLAALCELLRVPAGFVAAVDGTELMLEAVIGGNATRTLVQQVADWPLALERMAQQEYPLRPLSHAGFWLWPLYDTTHEDDAPRMLGALGVRARTETPLLSLDEVSVLERMLERITSALTDRTLQQGVFVQLRRIIPELERIQQWRGLTPYSSHDSEETATTTVLEGNPIHNPEFEGWVKDALSHYWGGPKLTNSPLVQLRVVAQMVNKANGDPTNALRLVLGAAIERLKPNGKPNLSAPEWLLYNILEMRFIQGRKVRSIAERLAMSESDLYRKQRVAIGHLAKVLSDMEEKNYGD